MFFKILKKDMVRKRTMNVIMLLFILLASMFMGSSVNNLAVSTTAVDNFFKLANTADAVAVTSGNKADFHEADEFLEQCEYIKAYDRDLSVMGAENYLYYENGKKVKLGNSDMGAFLIKNPQQYSLVYTTEDEPVAVRDGELAMSNVFADSANYKLGDKVLIRFEGYEKLFTISSLTKDAGFGTTLSGIFRMVLSDADYEEIAAHFPVQVAFYHLVSDDVSEAVKAVSENVKSIKTTVTQSVFKTCYIFDVMMAVIMLVVSICLLLIAFMILRFTIIYTLEDDYSEIGVLKAVGIRNRSIRVLYLAKYLALSVIGAVLGFIASIPFGNLLNMSLNRNIVVKQTKSFLWINILCAVLVVLLVVWFCYRCTKKLNRFSAIEAIRCGAKGDTGTSRKALRLSRIRKMSVPAALACNDVLSSKKRYVVMVITFYICMLLMIFPMVVVDTITDPAITLDLIGVENGGLYVYIPARELALTGDREYIEDYLLDMEEKIGEAGYPVTVSTAAFLTTKIKYPDGSGEYSVHSVMDLNTEQLSIHSMQGTEPVHANEFAMSDIALKEFGGIIGDTYHLTIGDSTYDMILVGSYSNMNNMGKTLHISNLLTPDFKQMGAIMPATIMFQDDLNEEKFKEAQEVIEALYPEFSVFDAGQYAENYMGTYVETFNGAGNIVIVIALAVVFLVALLMTKSFMTREMGEIALLKSIGVSNACIRRRHILRIVLCLATALCLLLITCIPITNVVIAKVFLLFGASNVTVAVNPLYIFIIYPGIVLADIILAGFAGTMSIRKIDTKNINVE